MTARLPEAYQWLLVPVQDTPQTTVGWQTFRLSGQDALAVRASKRLRGEELIVPALAGTRLRMELDKIPLWRGDHVAIKQLAEDFARYVYLPRLKDTHVLLLAVQDGLGLLLWADESFAYADSFDEAAGRYRGLRCGSRGFLPHDVLGGLLVKAEAARKQQAAEAPPVAPGIGGETPSKTGSGFADPGNGGSAEPAPVRTLKRFHGTVTLAPARVGRDAGRIADEVIAHLVGLVGSDVTVTLEIDALIPTGASDNVVRTVSENSWTLKFATYGFEEE